MSSRQGVCVCALRTALSRMVPIAHALPLLAGARVSPRCARVTFVHEPHLELRVSRLVIVCNPTHTRPRSPPHRERRTPNTASLCLLYVCRSETPKTYENSLNFLLPFPPKKTDFETETQKLSWHEKLTSPAMGKCTCGTPNPGQCARCWFELRYFLRKRNTCSRALSYFLGISL